MSIETKNAKFWAITSSGEARDNAQAIWQTPTIGMSSLVVIVAHYMEYIHYCWVFCNDWGKGISNNKRVLTLEKLVYLESFLTYAHKRGTVFENLVDSPNTILSSLKVLSDTPNQEKTPYTVGYFYNQLPGQFQQLEQLKDILGRLIFAHRQFAPIYMKYIFGNPTNVKPPYEVAEEVNKAVDNLFFSDVFKA